MRALSLAVVLASSPALAQPAPAQPAPEQAPSPEPEPLEVRVIGEAADALQKIPGSGTLIGSKEIRRSQPADLAEVLRRAPGVYVRQENGAGGRLDIGIRGLDPGRARRVLVLEDGIPVAINPYAEPDLYYAPPVERVRGIEVVKGSGAILFGPQTVGGVINFVTVPVPHRRSAALEVRGGQRRFVEVLGSYGDRLGDAGFVAQSLFKRGDGFRGEEFQTVDVFGKALFPTSQAGELTIKLGVHDHRSLADDVGLTAGMFRADPRRLTLAPDDALELRRYEIALLHEHRLLATNTVLRTLVYGYTTDRVWRRQEYHRFPLAGESYLRIVGDPSIAGAALYFLGTNRILDRSYQVAGIEPKLEQRFVTAGIDHKLEAGARLLGEAAQYQERSGESPASDAGALELDESRRSLGLAAYLQDRIAFREWLLATPGVRVEHARFRREIARQPDAGGARDVDIAGESDATAIIPGIGLVMGLPEAHGFAGFHFGFAPPRVTSSIRVNGETVPLEPERALHYELGTRVRPTAWLRAETAGFLSNFDNQVVASTDPDSSTELVNAGRTRHLGLEAAASCAFGTAFALPLAIDLTQRYTLLDARFVGGALDDHVLPYAPHHLLSTTLDLEHEIGAGAQLSWSYVSAHFADDDNTVAEDVTGRIGEIAGYHTLDLALRYHHALTGLTGTLTGKSLVDDVHVVSRRPEGIFAGGFRQLEAALRWDYASAD